MSGRAKRMGLAFFGLYIGFAVLLGLLTQSCWRSSDPQWTVDGVVKVRGTTNVVVGAFVRVIATGDVGLPQRFGMPLKETVLTQVSDSNGEFRFDVKGRSLSIRCWKDNSEMAEIVKLGRIGGRHDDLVQHLCLLLEPPS